MRTPALFLVFALACGGGSGSTDIAAMCQERVDSPTGCSDACLAAASEITTECAVEGMALGASADFSAFRSCVGACPIARTCTPMTGPEVSLLDCACGAACVRGLSAEFQRLFETYTVCATGHIDGVCQ
jgi:hypothetical protein